MSDEVNAGHLRAFIERIERLEEEKKQISDDVKEVYAEAKANGFDAGVIREIVKIRKADPDERRERETLLEIYMNALGMFVDTPLGQAAVERAKEAADRVVGGSDGGKRKPKGGLETAVRGKVRQAVEKLGKPVALTDEEKRKGVSAAFEGKDGLRTSISFGTPAGSA